MTRPSHIPDHNHKRLRAVLNVGFTAAAVRNYLAVFERTAQSVRCLLFASRSTLTSACRQLAEQLEDTSGVPIDVCPLLSFSTLNTISEGKPEQSPQSSSRDIPLAALGHPAKDLGEDFILKNSEIG
jgi:hypothetical protein